jgi:hypothetical protein
MPWIVRRGEAALRRGLERSTVRVGCDPARFGIYHCAEERLEVLRLGEEPAVMDKLQGRDVGRRRPESEADKLGLSYRAAIEHW